METVKHYDNYLMDLYDGGIERDKTKYALGWHHRITDKTYFTMEFDNKEEAFEYAELNINNRSLALAKYPDALESVLCDKITLFIYHGDSFEPYSSIKPHP